MISFYIQGVIHKKRVTNPQNLYFKRVLAHFFVKETRKDMETIQFPIRRIFGQPSSIEFGSPPH